MVEPLGCAMKAYVAHYKPKRLKIHGYDLSSSHQKFLDDILLIKEPTTKEASTFKQMLEYFKVTYSIKIIQVKSHILFFNTP